MKGKLGDEVSQTSQAEKLIMFQGLNGDCGVGL